MRYLLLSVLIISLVSMLFVPDAFAAFQITDDGTGGDCTSIGTWNSANKTCILGSNITQTVVIQSDGITFNGNGKLISVTLASGTVPGDKYGIYINGFDPSAKGSSTSRTSVFWRPLISVANFSREPPMIATVVKNSACRSRWTI